MSEKKANVEKFNLAEIESKIITARLVFNAQQAWFGSLVGKLKFQISTDIEKFPTCATDGKTIFFGAKYVVEHSLQELVFTIGHEVLHCLLNHHLRRTDSRDPKLWNCACDYVVNALLLNHKVGKMPSGALYDSSYKGLTSEEIYELLEKMGAKEKKKLFTLDDHSMMNGDEEGEGGAGMQEETAEEWNDALEEVLKGLGNNGEGSLEKDLKTFCRASQKESDSETTVDWRDELSEFIKTSFQADLTYLKPNRKTQSMGIVLPSIKNEERLNIAISLDTSGSINIDQLKLFLLELKSLLSNYTSFIIYLWCFDTRIHNYKIIESGELDLLDTYKPFGGGGTDFEANWEHLDQEDIRPDLLLMLTDGYPGGSWGDESRVDTLFAIVGDAQRNIVAPFGKTIYLN